ncbi:M16 family metallopeptidase [Mucilaginibacter sp. KACC 22063]|uniref:M16 family metallopeptidase n=1 Tax=Mucilaginibacter sp. KACC 22063 TaxID=3025666 RepID=UPI0023661BAA|nr:pitrilysin family protein [Mucilaginibacter sp. KACC 22063]WDF55344.1 pitrilysin family protein [Mucilaginibacter sp. KACC 22063]
MKKQILAVVSAMAIAATSFGQAKLVEKVVKKGNEVTIPYEKYVLPNGLTLILHEDHSDPLVHVDVTYHVGSAREEIGKSGFAHFFEHMMFEGSDDAPKGVHDKITIGNGGTNNGSTNRDRTNYYETVPANLLEDAVWLEADRMGFLLGQVTQDRFEVQRATVKNERGQNYDNRPYGLTSQYTGKNLYPYGHPYSWLTIGYIEDLNRSNVNDLKNFFLRWYGPNNATLTIGGDISPAATLKMVEKYFGDIPRCPAVQPVKVAPVSLQADRYVSYTDNYARLPMLVIDYPTVPEYTKDVPALDCLAEILGQGKNSILYQNLVKKQQALQASASSQGSELAGEFIVRIVPLAGKSLAEMEQLYRASLDSLEKNGISDDDLQKFKGGIQADFINDLQSVSGKVSNLAAYQTFTGNPNQTARLLREYTSLTKEQVMAAFHKYIKGKGAVVLSVLTKSGNVQPAVADNYTIDTTHYVAPNYGYAGLKYVKAKDNFNRKTVPPLGPAPVTKAPAFWRKDLSSGAKVIGVQNTEVPLVTLNITLPGGRLLEANDMSKLGLSTMFATMMQEDTKNYTAEQFANELQKLGSSIRVGADIDGIVFYVQSLKSNFPKTMALLQERIFNAKFTESAFNRNKKQALESFKIQKAQPSYIATAAFAKLNYGATNILGYQSNGNEKTVSNITLSDVENYYNNNLTANGAKVVAVGDITEAELLSQLAFMDKLPKKAISLNTPAPATAVTKTKIYLIDVPKAAQTEFRVGYGTNEKYDPTGEYYKAYLMNYPLGADFTSRVNTYLRETRGWTYGASTIWTGNKYSGDYYFTSGIRANATDSALVSLMKELTDYSQNGPTADEVTTLKKAISQGDALRYETAAQKARFVSRILDYNLPANYVDIQNKIIADATAQELKTEAEKWIKPAQINILLVGDKAAILPGLQKLGYEILELNADGDQVSAQ